MRRITLWILATVCGLVLLFSYRTSLGGSNDRSSQYADQNSGTSEPTADPASTASAGTSAGASSAASAAASSGKGDGTYTGSAVQTRHGTVQVKAKISGGKLTDVIVVKVPNGNHEDVQINNYAVPVLRKAALSAQSADIDTVSGATVTSDGYRESLQSALDAANFKG